ncbi:MAG: TetR/AcrR family transcriptional regulator [Thermoleophilaceae bacterium]|nr:TetR/AcrR family transcriptional regulator [Thermoleophilaceae bacterium]
MCRSATARPTDAASGPKPRSRDTPSRILDVAERLVQVRGFNGFSYADVASELDVTKASLHYHFPGKAELGEALITRYAERFGQALMTIEARTAAAPAMLEAYAGLYADVLRGRRMCLCGMLAAEYQTLPEPIRDAVLAFFDDNEVWLERVLEQGRHERSLRFEGPAREAARVILSGLEGAMLVARSYGDVDRFLAAATGLLASLSGAPAQRPAERSTAPARASGTREEVDGDRPGVDRTAGKLRPR